uniref:Prostate and testis expressed 2 n=2 Tax=Otolemur garnettii TaxID=30611 RepID=H0XKB6_OTOGA
MFRLLLQGIVMVLFMDEGDRVLTSKGIRYCNDCKRFDGYKCLGGMKQCWKFDIYRYNRSCATEHFYYSDRSSGRYLFRYSKLSCKICEEGMTQLFHDLLRETVCCTDRNRCNNGFNNLEITRIPGLEHEDELVAAS